MCQLIQLLLVDIFNLPFNHILERKSYLTASPYSFKFFNYSKKYASLKKKFILFFFTQTFLNFQPFLLSVKNVCKTEISRCHLLSSSNLQYLTLHFMALFSSFIFFHLNSFKLESFSLGTSAQCPHQRRAEPPSLHQARFRNSSVSRSIIEQLSFKVSFHLILIGITSVLSYSVH